MHGAGGRPDPGGVSPTIVMLDDVKDDALVFSTSFFSLNLVQGDEPSPALLEDFAP